MAPSEDTRINATETSIEILEYVVEAEGPVGISQVSTALDVPKSMAYNHLSTLQGLGYVVKRGQKYCAALRPLYLGNRVRDGLRVCADGRENIENLANATGETVELFVLEDRYAVPACIVRGAANWSSPHRLGERMPLHEAPPGKAILASLSTETAEKLLSPSVSAKTEDPDLDAIRADIQRVRDSGSVFSRGERYPNVVTVSSPIETVDAAPPAALAIVGPADRLQGRYLEEDLVGQLISTAEAISVAVAD